MELPEKLVEAMKRYYQNRKTAKDQVINGQKGEWDKCADLMNIEECMTENCVYFEATAGTFWFKWKEPKIVTTHSENNYRDGKIMSKWDPETEEWVDVNNGSLV